MQADEIIDAVKQAIPDAVVEAHLEGNHAHLTVVSAAFEGVSPVKKQQMVYAALQDAVASGVIHAVHMKTLTPDQHSG